jgi:hypothetical protein
MACPLVCAWHGRPVDVSGMGGGGGLSVAPFSVFPSRPPGRSAEAVPDGGIMLIDCERCEMRDIACADCVVTALLGRTTEIGEAERRALRVLSDAKLVSPLRMQWPVARAS